MLSKQIVFMLLSTFITKFLMSLDSHPTFLPQRNTRE